MNVLFTIAGWLFGFGLLVAVTTTRMGSLVAARRQGSAAGLLLGSGAGVLVYATVGTGVDELATWQYVLFVAAIAAAVAGFWRVGIVWAEDVYGAATRRHTRLLVGIALPMFALAVGLVGYWATRNDLPPRLASHFSGSQADDSMTMAQFAVVNSSLAGVGVLALLIIAVSRRRMPVVVVLTMGFLGGFLAGLGAGIFFFALLTQKGLSDWRDASGGLVTLGAIVLASALGSGAAWLASMLPTSTIPVPESSQRPTMDLGHGQHAVWSTTLHSRIMQVGAIAIGLMAVVITVAQGLSLWVLPTMVLPAIVIISLSRLRVRADGSGLHVAYGFLPWPSTTVAVDQIDTASVIAVRPMDWGGWGYRGSLKLMKQAAVVHRAGPGIRLDLDGGKVFVVTVDDPEVPVALLNAEVSRLTV